MGFPPTSQLISEAIGLSMGMLVKLSMGMLVKLSMGMLVRLSMGMLACQWEC